MAHLDGIDSEQQNMRPILIVSNNHLNETSSNVVAIPLTSQKKKFMPFHYILYRKNYPFFTQEKNTCLSECICHLSVNRIERYLGTIFSKDMIGILDCLQYVWKEKTK